MQKIRKQREEMLQGCGLQIINFYGCEGKRQKLACAGVVPGTWETTGAGVKGSAGGWNAGVGAGFGSGRGY